MSRYVHQVALRWSDMDVYGHVNNARILTLYEEARVALFFIGARRRGLTSFEEGIVIARHEVDYLRPLDYGAEPEGAGAPQVRVEMWVDEVRPSRFSLGYELLDDGRVASRARSICVPYDLRGQRPRRISDAERAFLEQWLASR